MKPGRLIRRYEHNHFRGWIVETKRQGRRWTKYFSDAPHGRAAALRRAHQYRETLLKRLPPPTKVKRRYVRNTTGEIGVALVNDRTRKGTRVRRYIAQWPTVGGRRMKASFSVALYGDAGARRRAVEARRNGLVALLSART